MTNARPATFGALKKSGYRPRSVKDELRANLIRKKQAGEEIFEGIWGYDHTVVPALERAILARHNINLLGTRGQAKTRIARTLVSLLDPFMPIVAGSEINDDPFAPISRFARDLLAEQGDATSIAWVPREERYTEKLATPDVTVADLIGDSDPIKAANLKLDRSDERVIHYGLVPRSNRGIFVINELPDLQPRIQVALFNILQEGDVQIRGFKLRMPLDVQFVFTANPEDYTNRGAIITPLKDRIQSQILTHYPKDIDVATKITAQESDLLDAQRERVIVPPLLHQLIEQIAISARESEYIDQKSGVSARLAISAMENLVSAAERRAIINNETQVQARINDLFTVVPAIIGKVELVYEGEQEGAEQVAQHLIGTAIGVEFVKHFPKPGSKRAKDPYQAMLEHFNGHDLDLLMDAPEQEFHKTLNSVPGLRSLVENAGVTKGNTEVLLWMELLLHGLAEHSRLSRSMLLSGVRFADLFSSMFSSEMEDGLAGGEDDR